MQNVASLVLEKKRNEAPEKFRFTNLLQNAIA